MGVYMHICREVSLPEAKVSLELKKEPGCMRLKWGKRNSGAHRAISYNNNSHYWWRFHHGQDMQQQLVDEDLFNAGHRCPLEERALGHSQLYFRSTFSCPCPWQSGLWSQVSCPRWLHCHAIGFRWVGTTFWRVVTNMSELCADIIPTIAWKSSNKTEKENKTILNIQLIDPSVV